MNKEQIEKNKTILKNKIETKYKGNEEQFFKELKTTSKTFWKHFEEGTLYLTQIYKAQNILELSLDEMTSIFFGETEISRKVLSFYNLMLKYIQPLTNEEKRDFLNLFQKRLDSLKEEQWWTIIQKKEKTIQTDTMKN